MLTCGVPFAGGQTRGVGPNTTALVWTVSEGGLTLNATVYWSLNTSGSAYADYPFGESKCERTHTYRVDTTFIIHSGVQHQLTTNTAHRCWLTLDALALFSLSPPRFTIKDPPLPPHPVGNDPQSAGQSPGNGDTGSYTTALPLPLPLFLPQSPVARTVSVSHSHLLSLPHVYSHVPNTDGSP